MSNDSRQDVAEAAAEEARPAPTPRESTPPEEGSAPEEVPAKPRRRLREAGKNLLTLTVSVVIALLLGEGGVRLFAPQQLVVRRTDVWLPVAGVGYKHAANIRTQANTGEQVVNIVTDEDGYRVGLDGRKQAEHNILLLGDSYMEALQVEYADSVAGLLEERLSKKLGVPIGVRNTGVSGYSPSQYLIVAKEELAKAHFDLVVVALYMGNDIEETRTDFFPPKTATGREFRMPKNLGREELMSAIAAPMDQALEAQSELYILVRKGLDNTRKEAGLVSRLLPPYFFKADPARGCDVTAAIALDIAKAAQEKGAQPVAFLIPARYQVDQASFAEYVKVAELKAEDVDLDKPNRMLGQALQNANVTVIDTLPELRAAHARGEVVFGTVDQHINGNGHRVVADALGPALENALRGAIAKTP